MSSSLEPAALEESLEALLSDPRALSVAASTTKDVVLAGLLLGVWERLGRLQPRRVALGLLSLRRAEEDCVEKADNWADGKERQFRSALDEPGRAISHLLSGQPSSTTVPTLVHQHHPRVHPSHQGHRECGPCPPSPAGSPEGRAAP